MASCSAVRFPTSTVEVSIFFSCGLWLRSSCTFRVKSSESRAIITTVVMSLSAANRRRLVSRPIPFEAPVTNAVLLIFALVFLKKVRGQPDIHRSGDLEVLAGSLDEVHRLAGHCHERGVLGEHLVIGHRVLVGLLQMRLVELLRQLHVAQAIALQ